MPKYIKIPQETKDEILKKIKDEGASVTDCSRQYGVNVKTIYGWLGSAAKAGSPILEINRLKRENEGLTALVGLLTVAAAKQKKGLPPERWFQS